MSRHLLAAIAVIFAMSSAHAATRDNELVKYCKSDIERLCKGVNPGDGRVLGCLKSHKKEMTVGCAQALQKIQKQAGK